MVRGSLVLVNCSGGEISPALFGRLDLPLYQKGFQRVQNYIVEPQGALRYRNAFKHVHNTRNLLAARLFSFSFSESDTYVIEATTNKFRFYRNKSAVLNSTSKTITAITKANPAVVTSAAHGFSNGDEVYITGIVGMVELNNQYFIVANVTANTFELQTVYAANVNSTNFTTYSSGGTATKPYDLTHFYDAADIPNLHIAQNADTLEFTNQNYPPMKLTRLDHTDWYFNSTQLSNAKSISGITKSSPGIFTTSTEHGLALNDLIWIEGVNGMTEVNRCFFGVKSIPTTTTFDVYKTDFGTALDTTGFTTYTSGGKVFKAEARTNDPFLARIIVGATAANPGVFTTSGAHGLKINDPVFAYEIGGTMSSLNGTKYLINTVPTTSSFSLKTVGGTPVNTTGLTWVSGGYVIKIDHCPKTVAYLDSARKAYANIATNPGGLYFSKAPDSGTGAAKYEDFTTGSNATDSAWFTIAPIFDKQDAVQFLSVSNKQVIAGCASSIRRVHGDTIDEPISPTSINAKPINALGSAAVQGFSNGLSLFYVDQSTKRLQGFQFTFQSSDFTTVNQNLISGQLTTSPFIALAHQKGPSGLLWVLREDGVLLGMTYNELESIYGWHRHYIGGQSTINSVLTPRAKVISIVSEPRVNAEPLLWAVIERKVGNNTYRSVEYMAEPIEFLDINDFFSDLGFEAQGDDIDSYNNATFEQLKDSVHVDSALTYDGGALSTTITMTPSVTTGTGTMTASASFFTSSMVGKEIWKKYDISGVGGGRARITGYTSATLVSIEVLSSFDSTSAIAAGSWFLTTNKVYGALHLVGETLTVQTDGAPAEDAVVASDGSITLQDQASKVHVGYGYRGVLQTLNLDLVGPRGSSEAKTRKIFEALPRFRDTVGAKIGTSLWNVTPITFKTIDAVTDRPTALRNGVEPIRPEDNWRRSEKQLVVVQDLPSPQTIISLDVMMESSNDD